MGFGRNLFSTWQVKDLLWDKDIPNCCKIPSIDFIILQRCSKIWTQTSNSTFKTYPTFQKNAPSKAHSAKPKDLHFLRLKFVSAFWCHVRACAFVPQAVRLPARYGSTWRHCHSKITEFKRENWLNKFIFLPKGWWQIHTFTLTKKKLDFQNFHQSEPFQLVFEKRQSFTREKNGGFPSQGCAEKPFAPPKKTHQDLWPPKPIWKGAGHGE